MQGAGHQAWLSTTFIENGGGKEPSSFSSTVALPLLCLSGAAVPKAGTHAASRVTAQNRPKLAKTILSYLQTSVRLSFGQNIILLYIQYISPQLMTEQDWINESGKDNITVSDSVEMFMDAHFVGVQWKSLRQLPMVSQSLF